MSQSKEGALKAKATMTARYGEDYFSVIGRVGGKNGNTGGFYKNPEAARKAGAKGGRISRRRKSV